MFPINLRKLNDVVLGTHFLLTEGGISSKFSAEKDKDDATFDLEDAYGMSNSQIILISEFGTPSQITTISNKVGNTITPTDALAHDFGQDTVVTVIPYDAMQLAWSPTFVLDPLTTAVLETKNLDSKRVATGFVEKTKTTGYYTARFVTNASEESGGGYTVYSDWTVPMPIAGNGIDSVEKTVMRAVRAVGNMLNDEYCREDDLVNDVVDCQDAIVNMRDWSPEQTNSVIPTDSGSRVFDINSLGIKESGVKKSIDSILFDGVPIDYVDYSVMERITAGMKTATVVTVALVGDIAIEFDDTTELQSEGEIWIPGIGGLTYTANDKSTMILTVAALTVQINVDTKVWQNAIIGFPTRYSIYAGEIHLDTVLGDTYGGISLKMKHLKELDEITVFQQDLEIVPIKTVKHYVCHRIEKRKENEESAASWLAEFAGELSLRIDKHQKPPPKTYSYASGKQEGKTKLDNERLRALD